MITWLMILYLVIGGISLALLIIMLIFGGFDLDVEGGPDIDIDLPFDMDIDVDIDSGSSLSVPLILGFLAMLGGIGGILTYFEFSPILTPFVSALASLFLAVILFLILNYFLKIFSSDSTVKYNDLLGKKASVSITINKDSEGQVVLFTEQRGRTLIPAVSDRKIPNNASVVIVGIRGDTVKVIPSAMYNKLKKKKGSKVPEKEKKKIKR